MSFSPIVHELLPAPDVEACFSRYRCLRYCLLLDSARRDAQLGRYSYLMADPVHVLRKDLSEILESEVNQDHFKDAATLLKQFETPALIDLPPFQGGLAGLLSYDYCHAVESLPIPAHDEFQIPALVWGLYDVVLMWDHQQNRAWLVSQGIEIGADTEGNANHSRRTQVAYNRLKQFLQLLDSPQQAASDPENNESSTASSRYDSQPDERTVAGLTLHQLAPSFPVKNSLELQELRSNFTGPEYLDAIRKAREYIFAGDVFQINLAQRLLHPATDESWRLYLRLRQRNAATFAGYFDIGSAQIISASPERFLNVENRQVEARPIKGTRPRLFRPEADLFSGDELQASDKDRAENIMIVDLLRNDLSRVCEPDSIRVSELCRIEMYEYVQHLVSVVHGKLRDDVSVLDLLKASWPGGSITGAPKIRAMEIITELEKVARGAYCGSLLYLGLDGSLDANLLIRTITASHGWWQFSVGGGITTGSEPEMEYEETWHKARGILQAIK